MEPPFDVGKGISGTVAAAEAIVKTTLTTATLVICALATVATVCLMFHEGNPAEPGWWPLFIAFLPWEVSPYCVLAAMALRSRAKPVKSAVIAVATLLITAFGAYVVVDAFFIHLDPQSGIALVILPALQWFGVIAAFVTATIADKVGRLLASRRSGSGAN